MNERLRTIVRRKMDGWLWKSIYQPECGDQLSYDDCQTKWSECPRCMYVHSLSYGSGARRCYLTGSRRYRRSDKSLRGVPETSAVCAIQPHGARHVNRRATDLASYENAVG